ncbi:MAG: TetR/AcrR family transcriptional regulator [Planctomycetota bacterium]
MARPREVTDEQIVAVARRCFLARGAGISAAEIAKELGVSHTTLFNRFGSKQALLIAALGPPERIPWVAALEAGPDERPLRDQLVEHAGVIARYFQTLQEGLSVLRAAGAEAEAVSGCKGKSPAQAFQALTDWLRRAQEAGRLGRCDVEVLASTILGALHTQSFVVRVCTADESAEVCAGHVERFVDLLWNGVRPNTPTA